MRLERSNHRIDLGKISRGARCAQAHVLEYAVDLAAGECRAAFQFLAQGFGAVAAAGKRCTPPQYVVRSAAPTVLPGIVHGVEALREVGVVDVVLRLHLTRGIDDLSHGVRGGRVSGSEVVVGESLR